MNPYPNNDEMYKPCTYDDLGEHVLKGCLFLPDSGTIHIIFGFGRRFSDSRDEEAQILKEFKANDVTGLMFFCSRWRSSGDLKPFTYQGMHLRRGLEFAEADGAGLRHALCRDCITHAPTRLLTWAEYTLFDWHTSFKGLFILEHSKDLREADLIKKLAASSF